MCVGILEKTRKDDLALTFEIYFHATKIAFG
jgi:hypothetical protein